MLVSKNSIQKSGSISTYGLLKFSMLNLLILMASYSEKLTYLIEGQSDWHLIVNPFNMSKVSILKVYVNNKENLGIQNK